MSRREHPHAIDAGDGVEGKKQSCLKLVERPGQMIGPGEDDVVVAHAVDGVVADVVRQ